MKKETKQLIIKIITNTLNFLFASIIIVFAFISIFDKELMIQIIKWFENIINYIGNWNYVIAFSSSLIETFPVLGVVIPGQNILLLVAIFFAKQSAYNLVLIYILAILGAICGNYVGYFLGKIYGDSFFDKYGLWFGIGKTELKYMKKGIHKWGPIGITLGKFHNVARAFIPFIAGGMGMKGSLFMFYNAIGSFLRAVTIITIGVVFGSHYETIIEYIGTIMLVIMLLVFGYIYFFKRESLKDYIKEKNEELNNL